MHTAYTQIAGALQDYFDGLYRSDTRLLARIFHPKAVYACATSGELVRMTMDEYFRVVDARPSPAGLGEPRRDEVVSIELAGPSTAFVHARCAIGVKRFTDFLTLVRLDGQWRILSKVFHYDPKET
jgi:hypothetical protein